MTIPVTDLIATATQPEHLASLLSNANALALTTTSWQSGAPERTIFAIMSYALNFEDATTSIIAQSGFLDFAATGTTTYTIPSTDGSAPKTITVPVTPDPSDPVANPTGALGRLDALASSVYNVRRILATYAGGAQAILNTSASTYGPFAAGTYHIADPFTKATYSNAASLTIAPSSIAGTSIAGVVGSGGLIQITTTTNHGLASGAAVFVVGAGGVPALTASAWYIDVVSATVFTLRLSSFAGSYTTGGTVYVPTVATFRADTIGSASNSLDASGVLAIHTVTAPVTTLVGVSIDNLETFAGSNIETNVALAARCRLKLQSLSPNGPGGAYEYAALSSQQLAGSLSPPQILSQAITRAKPFADKPSGTVVTYIANASGQPSAPDVVVAGLVVQAYAVPLGVTASTVAAINLPVAAVLDVWVPPALNNAATKLLFQVALMAYFAKLPIGGVTDPGGSYTNVVPFDAVLGAIFSAGSLGGVPVQQAELTLNGGTSDIALAFSLASANVAILSPSPPSVTLHSTS